jgi:hypothetical protein
MQEKAIQTNPMEDETTRIAAQYIAAMQYVQILALRNTGTVHHTEISQITSRLPRFLEMPDDLVKEVKAIRLEKYNIE